MASPTVLHSSVGLTVFCSKPRHKSHCCNILPNASRPVLHTTNGYFLFYCAMETLAFLQITW